MSYFGCYEGETLQNRVVLGVRLGRLKRGGTIDILGGKARRRRKILVILGPRFVDFTRENGQKRGPKRAKSRDLTVPPLVFRNPASKGGGTVTPISPDTVFLFIFVVAKLHQFVGTEGGEREGGKGERQGFWRKIERGRGVVRNSFVICF